jgi:hypothetical protein
VPAVASSHTGLTPPASAGRVNSNVRPHTFMSQRARHHPSSLRPAYSFVPRAQRMQISAPERKTRSAPILPSAETTQQRLEPRSRPSASHRVAGTRLRLKKVSFLFRRRAEKLAFGQQGQRRLEKTANAITTRRPDPATRAASSPTPSFAVRPNYIVQPGPATAGVASPVRACRSIVADRACNTCLRGPG